MNTKKFEGLTVAEIPFWQAVYVATCSAGSLAHEACSRADLAVKSLRDRATDFQIASASKLYANNHA